MTLFTLILLLFQNEMCVSRDDNELIEKGIKNILLDALICVKLIEPPVNKKQSKYSMFMCFKKQFILTFSFYYTNSIIEFIVIYIYFNLNINYKRR